MTVPMTKWQYTIWRFRSCWQKHRSSKSSSDFAICLHSNLAAM